MPDMCELCDDYPGGEYRMDRACCVARLWKRAPPHFDRKAAAAQLETERGSAFLAEVRDFYKVVE